MLLDYVHQIYAVSNLRKAYAGKTCMADIDQSRCRVDLDVQTLHAVPVTMFAGAKMSNHRPWSYLLITIACALCKLHAALCHSMTLTFLCTLRRHLHVAVLPCHHPGVLIASVPCAASPGHTAGIATGGIWI